MIISCNKITTEEIDKLIQLATQTPDGLKRIKAAADPNINVAFEMLLSVIKSKYDDNFKNIIPYSHLIILLCIWYIIGFIYENENMSVISAISTITSIALGFNIIAMVPSNNIWSILRSALIFGISLLLILLWKKLEQYIIVITFIILIIIMIIKLFGQQFKNGISLLMFMIILVICIKNSDKLQLLICIIMSVLVTIKINDITDSWIITITSSTFSFFLIKLVYEIIQKILNTLLLMIIGGYTSTYIYNKILDCKSS